MSNKPDNLHDLLRRFSQTDAAQAEAMAEDIRRGDALLERYPSPVMPAEATARVRGRLTTAVADRRRRQRRARWIGIGMSATAAAAAAMVVLYVGSSQRPPTPAEAPSIAQAPTVSEVEVSSIVQTPPPVEVVVPERRPLDRSELPSFTLNLWDDGHHTDSDQAFAAIKSELDDIAAWIDAVGVMDAPFSDERLLNGETASQRNDQSELTEFWKG